MAERIEAFTVTVPVNTAQASPQVTNVSFNPGNVVGIQIIIPAGHAGLTGIALRSGKSQYVPRTSGSFVVSDDEVVKWDVEGAPGTGNWEAVAFNTDDSYSHSFFLRFLVNELRIPGVEPAPPFRVSPEGEIVNLSVPVSAPESGTGGTIIPEPSFGLPAPAPELALPPVPEAIPEPALPELPALEGPSLDLQVPETAPAEAPVPPEQPTPSAQPAPYVPPVSVLPKTGPNVFYNPARGLRYIIARKHSVSLNKTCDYHVYESELNKGDWGRGGEVIDRAKCA